MTDIPYVIYCRKSTDENSWQQTQSIPDQIRKCIDYAKSQWLLIREKPEDFSMFEAEYETTKEDNDEDIYNRKIFQETRNLFIIKEQESAKVPGLRPKWKKLISQIKQGKIKWLLSYSPDRQARNMVEWGDIIDCVDRDLVDLKYTNFHFEDTASGKMMLGIWFVFSKQYSDKLSEDVSRGNKTAVARGKAMGRDKHWYYRDEQEHFRPDGRNFDLMRMAFQMKLYDNKSDLVIASWLNSHGFTKKSGKKIVPANYKLLFRVRIDPVYYGVHRYGNNMADLREAEVDFQPMITEHEHKILLDRFQGNKPLLAPKEIKEEHEEIMGLPRGLLKSSDWYVLAFNLPNKQRFYDHLERYRKADVSATLKDVIKSKQCRYKVVNAKSKCNGLEVTFDVIEKAILEKLKKIKVDEELYRKFMKFINSELDITKAKAKLERTRITLQISKVNSEKTNFIKRNLWFEKTAEERRIYEDEVKRLENQIGYLEDELNTLATSERNVPFEFEAIIKILQTAVERYKKFTFVQKKQFAQIVYSNIIIDNKKRLTFEANPIFEWLFIKSFRRAGIRTQDLILKRDLL